MKFYFSFSHVRVKSFVKLSHLCVRQKGARPSCPHAGETLAFPGLHIKKDCSILEFEKC
jgi:hypothetical protein